MGQEKPSRHRNRRQIADARSARPNTLRFTQQPSRFEGNLRQCWELRGDRAVTHTKIRQLQSFRYLHLMSTILLQRDLCKKHSVVGRFSHFEEASTPSPWPGIVTQASHESLGIWASVLVSSTTQEHDCQDSSVELGRHAVQVARVPQTRSNASELPSEPTGPTSQAIQDSYSAGGVGCAVHSQIGPLYTQHSGVDSSGELCYLWLRWHSVRPRFSFTFRGVYEGKYGWNRSRAEGMSYQSRGCDLAWPSTTYSYATRRLLLLWRTLGRTGAGYRERDAEPQNCVAKHSVPEDDIMPLRATYFKAMAVLEAWSLTRREKDDWQPEPPHKHQRYQEEECREGGFSMIQLFTSPSYSCFKFSCCTLESPGSKVQRGAVQS